MSGFKFQFESILKHRQEAQMEAQELFLMQRERYDAIIREVETIKEKLNDASEMLSSGELGFAHHYQAMQQYRQKLEQDLKLKEIESKNQKQALLSAKEELFEATKELKIIEKLKEHQLNLYQKEEQLKESKFLDELVSMKAARNNS